MAINAYSTILLFVSTSLPPIPTATLQKYFTTLHTFFLTYYKRHGRLAEVVEEGNVTIHDLYVMKKELHTIHRQATIAAIVSLGAWLIIILTLILGS